MAGGVIENSPGVDEREGTDGSDSTKPALSAEDEAEVVDGPNTADGLSASDKPWLDMKSYSV
jgi:hypothetical protein